MLTLDLQMPLRIGSKERERSVSPETTYMHALAAVMSAAALLALWSLTHRYRGLSGDAELYAVQALAKIVPSLGNDVFLRGESQDRYTVFSPFYAVFIGWFGVRIAAISLMVFFKVWFYCASWALLRAFLSPGRTFFAVALLIVLNGDYGAYSVFKYGEDFLTARTAVEALVITACALNFRGNPLLGFLVVVTALLVHPLMALPGLMLLIFYGVSWRWGAMAATGAIVAALVVACYGSAFRASTGLFATLDGPWLEVVRERSQFLFLQLWSSGDWMANSRPLISLLITLLADTNPHVRRLGWSCILLGLAGLVIACIAGTIGPVAILIQGQAWRWLWIPAYMSVALLVPTLVNVLRDEKFGHLYALLIIGGWAVSPANGVPFLLAALLLWSARGKLGCVAVRHVQWCTWGFAVILAASVLKTSWDALGPQTSETGLVAAALARTRVFLGVQAAAVMLSWLVYQWIGWSRSAAAMLVSSTAFAAASAVSLPVALARASHEDAISEINEFEDWRTAIPPQSNVYVMPAHNSAAFAWFTLQRPSYLSLDQSSGVVFSRDTALEIERRSMSLLPVAPLDWKLLSAMKERRRGEPKKDAAPISITPENLIAICSDSQLGFVVAQSDVGFAPIKHLHSGRWMDWNLYDCVRVRASLADM